MRARISSTTKSVKDFGRMSFIQILIATAGDAQRQHA
jgi:hypothetical protein